MTLKEFCSVWDFQYPYGIARIEVKNNDHFVFEDGYIYPDELLHLIYSDDNVANLRVVNCYFYEHVKMGEMSSGVKTLRIEVVDNPNEPKFETFNEFENRIFGKNGDVKKTAGIREKVKSFFNVKKDDTEELSKYEKDPYFWMKFLEEE